MIRITFYKYIIGQYKFQRLKIPAQKAYDLAELRQFLKEISLQEKDWYYPQNPSPETLSNEPVNKNSKLGKIPYSISRWITKEELNLVQQIANLD